MPSFKVFAEDLTNHAGHLDELCDRMDTAIEAARVASMSDEAYGVLCSFLPPIVNPLEEEGIGSLKSAREGLGRTAHNVRRSAAEYRDADESGARSLREFDDAVRVRQSAVALRGLPPVGDAAG